MIRRALSADAPLLARMASRMWSASPSELEADFAALTVSENAFCCIASEGDTPVGFAQCQLRHDYVEGCSTSPVGFLEGVWVDPAHQRRGVARQLVAACEDWARTRGCTEFASDCELDNHESLLFHLAAGFEEAGRTIWFRKTL